MARHSPRYRSELKTVRGLGSAHSGTGHFWFQRTTAIALVPLSIWFVVQLLTVLLHADLTVVHDWFKHPVNAMLMAVLVVALFWHSKLGIQVIIEDYVHAEGKKIALLLFNSGAHLLLALASVTAIARLHFFG